MTTRKDILSNAALKLFVGGAMAAATAWGASEWDPAGSGNWADATRWKKGATPTAGSEVYLNNCTGIVTAADAELFAKVGKITVGGAAGCFVISNDASEARLVSPATFAQAGGKILKLGSGEANLTHTNSAQYESYFLTGGVEVRDGLLSFRDAKGYADGGNNLYLCKVAVWAPGRFQSTQLSGLYVSGGLYGDGVVTNDTLGQANRTLRFVGSSDAANPAVFSGRFTGDSYFCTAGKKGYQLLTGVDSANAPNRSFDLLLFGQGTLGVAKIGCYNDTSSWGSGSIQWRCSGPRLVYLGEGETANRKFNFGNSAQLPTLDAGEHGGLNLIGEWSVHTECRYMNGLDLAGNGTNVFGGDFSFPANTSDGLYRAIYVRKTGDGAWRFTKDKKREMRGTFETRRGELQFESIAEKGTTCSLGDASMLYSRHFSNASTIDESLAVPYAYLLGDGATGKDSPALATMNYVGEADASVSTRPIAVNGAGRLKSDGGALTWGGVTSANAGENVIVFGGAAENCAASGVTNGPGTLAVAKDGEGTWSVGGDYDFSGAVDVTGGRLRLASERYEWYRLTIMGTWIGATNAAGEALSGDGGRFMLSQWALLDDDGENQVVGLAHAQNADGDPLALKPGEAAMANTNYCYLGYRGTTAWQYGLTNLFTSSGAFAVLNCHYTQNADGSVTTNEYGLGAALYADPKHHVRVVVRLPKGANKVTHYDLCSVGWWPKGDSSTVRIPRSWRVEGSADGMNWDVLHEVISNSYENIVTVSGGGWFSSNTAKDDLREGYGPYPSGDGAKRPSAVAGVSAAPGATLESLGALSSSSLVYDCAAGAGAISGVTLAPGATIEVKNFTEDKFGVAMPIDFAGKEAYAGRRFPMVVNGVSHPKWIGRLDADGLRVYKLGTTIIVR